MTSFEKLYRLFLEEIKEEQSITEQEAKDFIKSEDGSFFNDFCERHLSNTNIIETAENFSSYIYKQINK